ncbi:MAG: T9SS type A sorting domain-containing protein [Flavobacteriales bacterium]|nr:T9SS type A sorting domain-containing protein [Flavobacteriales bacterium]
MSAPSLHKYLKVICLFIFISGDIYANPSIPTVYEQLCELNKDWCTKNLTDPILDAKISLSTDIDLITTHLRLVEAHLRSKNIEHLPTETQKARLENLDLLKEYWQAGVYPVNLYHNKRTPYFIDDYGTACAVGHLVIGTGHAELARTIQKENNYEYLFDLNEKYPSLGSWAAVNGFTLEELAWIQPGYGCSGPTCPPGVQYNVSCYGACDGCAQPPTPTWGVSPYTYTWDIGNGNGCDLCAGTYTVVIEDATGTIQSYTYTITEPPPMNILFIKGETTCFGYCDGFVTALAIGGTAPYTYLWSNSGTGPTISSLCAGNYCVTVTDNNGCQEIACDTILEPLNLSSSVTTTPVSCAGYCDGTAQAYFSGGNQPYTHLWTDSTGDTVAVGTTIVFSLCPGTYVCTTFDTNSCSTSTSFTINGPDALISAISNATNVTCNGICNGSATIAASGGTPPYSYFWMNGCTTSTCPTLCAGTHSVLITDAMGCTVVDSIIISETSPIVITGIITDVSCYGGSEGAISINVTGGTPSYSYQGMNIGGNMYLNAGTYTIIVTDINGCSTTQSYTVIEPPVLMASGYSAPSNCGNDNGEANVSPTGGTTPYSYDWLDNQGNTIGQNTPTATGLASGTYDAMVTDSNGCTSTISIPVVDISGPLIDSISGINVDCYGDCNGMATAYTNGGTMPLSYTWSDGQVTPTATGLCAGTYNFTITDLNGCIASDSIFINEPDPIILLTLIDDPIICSGDSTMISVIAAGGLLPYTFIWDNGLGNGANHVVSPSAPTIYQVVTVDDAGCSSDTGSITLMVLPPLSLTLTLNDSLCKGDEGIIVASGNGGIGGPYTYLWDDGSTNAFLLIAPDSTTTYSVTISDNCSPDASDSILVEVEICLTIPQTTDLLNTLRIYPNPNAGLFTVAFNLERRQDVSIEIFSGTGQLVFQQRLPQHQGAFMRAFEMKDQAPGIYMLHIVLEKRLINRKLIIE